MKTRNFDRIKRALFRPRSFPPRETRAGGHGTHRGNSDPTSAALSTLRSWAPDAGSGSSMHLQFPSAADPIESWFFITENAEERTPTTETQRIKSGLVGRPALHLSPCVRHRRTTGVIDGNFVSPEATSCRGHRSGADADG